MSHDLKFGSDYQACAHSFAYANKDDRGANYGNRMFYYNDTIYSYGHHFIIAKKVRNKAGHVQFVLYNSGSASVTTNKQQWAVLRALPQKVITVSTGIQYFNAKNEIMAKEMEVFLTVSLYNNARAEHTRASYLGTIQREIKEMMFLAKHYRIMSKLPKRIKQYFPLVDDVDNLLPLLGVSRKNRAKAVKAEETKKAKLREAAERQEAAKEREKLEKWLMHDADRIYLRHIREDYLRMSKDGANVETTQGISVTNKEALTLYRMIKAGKDVKGHLISGYMVISVNGTLKIGCHNINMESVHTIGKQLIAA